MPASLEPEQLLALVPVDGTPIGNTRLRELLSEKLGRKIGEKAFAEAREDLVKRGDLAKGSGRGGSVRRVRAGAREDLALTMPASVEKPKAERSTAQERAKRGTLGKAAGNTSDVLSYRHDQKRRNNPEAGMVNPESDPDETETRWAYDPHVDPALQFDIKRAAVEEIIDDALGSGNEGVMREALATLKRMAEPYLNWAGKVERTSFEVDTVSLHVHERIDPATILNGIRRRMTRKGEQKVTQPDFFRAWFEEPLPYHKAVEFYKHDRGWANRLVSGDSLLVMNSLLKKEGMAGQVQMIYIDPPYGITYGSNFQPFTDKKPSSRTDKDEDLTQEPETIKAFRDTWELGIHSYLTYLRDRLLLARELLHTSGSVFVQISDENHHLIRSLLSETFGENNLVVSIPIKKKGSQKGGLLDPVNDYLVWAAKDKSRVKAKKLFLKRENDEDVTDDFSNVLLADGTTTTLSKLERQMKVDAGTYRKDLTRLAKDVPGARLFKSDPSTSGNPGRSQARVFDYHGQSFDPGLTRGLGWKAAASSENGLSGMDRLAVSGRLYVGKEQLGVRRYPSDFGFKLLSNWWDGLGGASDPIYVVQTNDRILERCVLITTDPGDLVFDPTCGSGTTSYVAERWGRRWITCDTSRVAITLAKQRLMTASYDYYALRYPHEGLRGDFVYNPVPHVTAAGIANNPELDEILERMRPPIQRALAELNSALRKSPPAQPFEVAEGGREGSTVDFRAHEDRTVDLPSGDKAPAGGLLDWEVPFDFPADWPHSARSPFETFNAARLAMQRQMDASIAAHAEPETRYDDPHVAKDKLRVTGPFTVEAVPFPSVLALDEAKQSQDADLSVARSGESARQHDWRDELLKTGIRGKSGQTLKFAQLETLPGTKHLHCTGTLADTGERVVVSFGPEHAALEQRQVELAMREAGELFPRPKMIVYCAFAFDPEAAKDIDATKGITSLKAQMNTDLLTEDLKKARASNQSFWLIGQPDVDVRRRKDGTYEVEVNGFDYFDTLKGELVSGGKGKIAAWMLDTDYDERSLFPRQVFFPMAGAKDGWQKLKKDIKAELDEALLLKLHSTVSLPFDAGENKKVAVKIVDDRGIESLKIILLS